MRTLFVALLVGLSGCSFFLGAAVCDDDGDCAEGRCGPTGFCADAAPSRDDGGPSPRDDAGLVADAGPLPASDDAGVTPDAGQPEGPRDAGRIVDAGEEDAGANDAGLDAGVATDAGVPDAGADSGPPPCDPEAVLDFELRVDDERRFNLDCTLPSVVFSDTEIAVTTVVESGRTTVTLEALSPARAAVASIRFGGGVAVTTLNVKVYPIDWFDFRFTDRVPIDTFSDVGDNVIGVPIRASFSTVDWPIQPREDELRFAQGLDQIPAEVIKWAPGSGGDLWLRADVGPDAPTSYLYLAAEVPDDIDILPSTDVWVDYLAVWHVAERLTNSAAGPEGSVVGDSQVADYVFGQGINDTLANGNALRMIINDLDPSPAITFTAWGQRFGGDQPFNSWFRLTDCESVTLAQFRTQRLTTPQPRPEFIANVLSATRRVGASPSDLPNLAVLRVDGSAARARLFDGVADFGSDAGALDEGVTRFCIELSENDFEGALDEMRLARVAFSDDRLFVEEETGGPGFVFVGPPQKPH